MRRLLLLLAVLAMAMLVAAPAALGQSRGPSGADGTYNCSDFDTQLQAQAYYDGQGGLDGPNPADLDDDLDGVPCETLPGGGVTPTGGDNGEETPIEPAATGAQYGQYGGEEPTPAEPTPVEPTPVEPLPATGGPGGAALLLPAAGLLLATGLIGSRVLRRRS